MIEEMDDEEKRSYLEEEERVNAEFEELGSDGSDDEYFNNTDEYMGF
jgi:hypothetical protein